MVTLMQSSSLNEGRLNLCQKRFYESDPLVRIHKTHSKGWSKILSENLSKILQNLYFTIKSDTIRTI